MAGVLSPLGKKRLRFPLLGLYLRPEATLCLAGIMQNQMYKLSHTTCSQFLPAHICPRKDKYSFESNRQIGYLPFCITFKIKMISGVSFFAF